MLFTQYQRETLEKRAAETGRYRDVLFLCAILRDYERVDAFGTGPARDNADDTFVYDLLSLWRFPERAVSLLARFDPEKVPHYGYCLVKHFLSQNDLTNALRAAKMLLERDRHHTIALNLIAQYLAVLGQQRVALSIIANSLQLNPHQRDLVLLRDALARNERIAIDLDLASVPKLFDISFYVPVYNGELYVRETIEALLAQNYPLREILIVDDGSRDGTETIAAEYPVRLIRFPENRGLAAARNAALRESESQLLGAVDADVCASPSYTLEILAEFENAMPALAGVGGRLIERNTEFPADKWRAVRLRQGWYPHRMYFDGMRAPEAVPDISDSFFLNGCNNVFRRDYALAVGGYNEKYRTNAEDAELCQKLRRAGLHLAFSRYAETYHCRRDTVASVLRTAWNYTFWHLSDSGLFDSASIVLSNLGRAVDEIWSHMETDWRENNHDLLYVDFLSLFQWPLMDIGFACERGLFTPPQGTTIQHFLLGQLKRSDHELGDRLYERVHRDCGHLLLRDSEAPDCLPADMYAAVHTSTAPFTEILGRLPGEVYGILLERSES